MEEEEEEEEEEEGRGQVRAGLFLREAKLHGRTAEGETIRRGFLQGTNIFLLENRLEVCTQRGISSTLRAQSKQTMAGKIFPDFSLQHFYGKVFRVGLKFPCLQSTFCSSNAVTFKCN